MNAECILNINVGLNLVVFFSLLALCLMLQCAYVLLLVEGYQVYLVGGCVRDLVLKRTPKDFDVITSAELKEVALVFHLDMLLGLFCL